MADSGAISEAYYAPQGEHELAFLRSEWERLAKNSEDTVTRFATMEKRLAAYDTHFDSVDRRFDQLIAILIRVENNQLTDKAQGKMIASPHDSSSPILMSSSRSPLDHHPMGFGAPASFSGRSSSSSRIWGSTVCV